MTQQPSFTSIQNADRAALTAIWASMFETTPPPSISQPLMRMILSFESQVRTYGGLDRVTKRAILRLHKKNQTGQEQTSKIHVRRPAPGTRLIREWHGKTDVVERTTNGYDWDGRTFKSLSAVASAITGTRWSGPGFFGLKGDDG